MSCRISSFFAGLGVLLIAAGVSAVPAFGPVQKGGVPEISEQNAKPKPKKKKKAVEVEELEEEEVEEKPKKKAKKGKKGKKAVEEVEEEEEVEEKPKKKAKKGKKGKKAVEEEEEVEEKPKKKGKKGKKGKKAVEEEEELDLEETEAPEVEPEPEEIPEEEPPPEEPADEPTEGEEAEASASVSTADAAGKLYLGLRLGYGIPMGNTTGDENALEFSGKVPIWIDLGYRISPNFLVALYGQYAFASIECPDGPDCSATVLRFGAQAHYNFAPDAQFDPWVGFGLGYEIASATVTFADGEDTYDLRGVEFANLQAGVDYKVSKNVGVGPFLSFSFGRYSAGEQQLAGFTESGGVTRKEFHEWLVLGVRGAFSL